MKNNILFLISFIFSLSGFSQCGVGLSEVYLTISPGVYFVRVVAQDQTFETKRLIVK